jgi:hypothetical protein
LALDPASGAVAARAVIGQPLSGGVIAVGDQAVVASIDGTLYHVDSILEQPKKKT